MTDKSSTSKTYVFQSSLSPVNQDNTKETEDEAIKSEKTVQTNENENIPNVESINSIEEAYQQVLNLKKAEENKIKIPAKTKKDESSSQDINITVNPEDKIQLTDQFDEKSTLLERNFEVKPNDDSKFPKKDLVEKIILCIDSCDDMFSQKILFNGQKLQLFQAVFSAVTRFVKSKSFINNNHQFSLINFNSQDNEVQLMTQLNSDYKETVSMLQDIWNTKSMYTGKRNKSEDMKSFNVCKLLKQLTHIVRLPDATDDYIVRCIFVYTNSQFPVTLSSTQNQEYKDMLANPKFFFDIIHLHEIPSEDNNVKEVFESLCKLDDSEKNYIENTCLSCNEENLTQIFKISDNFTNLMFHPLQRCLPLYKYTDQKPVAVE